MEKIFHDILHIEGVHGLTFLAKDGTLLFKYFSVGHSPEQDRLSWEMIVAALDGFHELNLVYERGRFYIRKTGNGFLLISMDSDAPISLVKLNCDIIIPELQKNKRSRGFKRFFGKKW